MADYLPLAVLTGKTVFTESLSYADIKPHGAEEFPTSREQPQIRFGVLGPDLAESLKGRKTRPKRQLKLISTCIYSSSLYEETLAQNAD